MFEKVYEEFSKSSGWIKFLGILYIIGGVLSALTIIGLIYAWLPIWIGIILYQAGNLAKLGSITKDEGKILESLSKIRFYFVISVIAFIVSYALVIIVSILYLIEYLL